MDIAIIATGTANTASVTAWLRRAGLSPRLTTDPADALHAPLLVLPGVGAFGAAMAELAARNLVEPLRARLRADRPLLAICLGMQLLFESSEESPGVPGLGVIPGTVRRLPRAARVPHMGWNTLFPLPPGEEMVPRSGAEVALGAQSTEIPPGHAYFANSYAVFDPPRGWASATTSHVVPFISAISRGAVLACQFHPELSGAYGRTLLDLWLASAREPCVSSAPSAPLPLCPSAPSLTRRIIPCLDVRDGRVVKGVKFADLRDAGDPAACAAAYESHGADELVILDVSATPEGRRANLDTVRAIRARLSIPLTVGGGVHSLDDASALLDAGADKVAINTAAVENPSIISTLAERFGSQCTVVAIDAARSTDFWVVVTRSGKNRTDIDAVRWATTVASLGAGEILLTSFDRDGTRAGYDLDLIRAVRAGVNIPFIASGGADSPGHMVAAFDAGADAALAASIFHDANFTVADVKAALAQRGVEIRP